MNIERPKCNRMNFECKKYSLHNLNIINNVFTVSDYPSGGVGAHSVQGPVKTKNIYFSFNNYTYIFFMNSLD